MVFRQQGFKRTLFCAGGLALLLTGCGGHHNCAQRPLQSFDKITMKSDARIQHFLAPIDSVDHVIESLQLDSRMYTNDTHNSKFSWMHEGRVIKMAVEGYIEDAFTGSAYTVLDDCNWMLWKVNIPADTAIAQTHHYFSFRDSILLNAFVTTSESGFELFTNLDSNAVVREQAKIDYRQYKDFLRLVNEEK